MQAAFDDQVAENHQLQASKEASDRNWEQRLEQSSASAEHWAAHAEALKADQASAEQQIATLRASIEVREDGS